MALEKPVVAYKLPETQYTAQDAAIYVEPGDAKAFGRAILSLLEDPQRRKDMGEFGRKRVLDSLSWESQKDGLLRAYAIALGEMTTQFSHNDRPKKEL
jgi:glycosyltransferase involved in cell wall biosynthesis